MLGGLPALLDSVGVPADDPAAARLDPSPYPEDPTAAEEFRRLMGGELEQARSADRSRFSEWLERPETAVLDDEQAGAWLRVLGESRLVLAARLGIEEDGWETGSPPGDPAVSLLHYLGWLQEELVEALGFES